eukprot:Em0653g4a
MDDVIGMEVGYGQRDVTTEVDLSAEGKGGVDLSREEVLDDVWVLQKTQYLTLLLEFLDIPLAPYHGNWLLLKCPFNDETDAARKGPTDPLEERQDIGMGSLLNERVCLFRSSQGEKFIEACKGHSIFDIKTSMASLAASATQLQGILASTSQRVVALLEQEQIIHSAE